MVFCPSCSGSVASCSRVGTKARRCRRSRLREVIRFQHAERLAGFELDLPTKDVEVPCTQQLDGCLACNSMLSPRCGLQLGPAEEEGGGAPQGVCH